MEDPVNMLESVTQISIVIVLFALVYVGTSWIFKRLKSDKESVNIVRNSILSLVVLIGLIVFILSLPIDKNLKGQIISFLGIIISAAIALSSTTLLGNFIAGIMNNTIDRFKHGDLIHVEEFKGRVTKKRVFHIEIQLEDSNFVTIPNLFIASNPVKITRKSNTVISTSVSLGYDVSRSLVEKCLKEAALKAGLTEPFVYIMALGDFSVTYKVHGFLDDSDKYYSSSSLLNGKVMDALHENRVEIVSPTFMNQRRIERQIFIPKGRIKEETIEKQVNPEELIFDKAFKSEDIENRRKYLKEIELKKKELNEVLKKLIDEKEKENMKLRLLRLEEIKQRIENYIKEENNKLNEDD
jgi:small-conductance mechanosensitive channel